MQITRFLRSEKGLTLFELLIVMTVMAILATISIPSYKRSQIKARESVLLEDLFQLRKAIDAYYADHESYPAGLSDLVEGKYVRAIPRDPMTQSTETWECVSPEVALDGTLQQGGCFDVHSGSHLVGLNGVVYANW